MKFLTYLTLVLIPFGSLAQNLQNTIWQTYNANLFDTVTVQIGNDTVKQFIQSDSLLVVSLYNTSNDTVAILDISGPLMCLEPDTGYYGYTVVNDTLTLILLKDECLLRGLNYDGTILWKVYDFNSIKEQVINEKVFKVYPNPSNGFVTLNMKDAGSLRIFNSNGQLLYFKEVFEPNTSITTNLNKGYYIVRFRSGQHIYSEKLIVR